ncbi:MAG: alpha/beta hydrolase [Verrucomicrobiales bacterium]|nr:alpha/beta hydrolase [Verrucomicrobiales bacterium]
MKFFSALFCLFSFFVTASDAFDYPPVFEDATEYVYQTAGDVPLKMWSFRPHDWKPSDARPAIVFFFGGGWNAGSPAQFETHAEYLADRGMVAFVADYRVATRHGTLAKDCVEDARDAMRFIRKNAAELGVDPGRVGAGGGSAGGHIAACLGVIPDDPGSKPELLALFNPACVIAPFEGKDFWGEDRSEEMKERMGVEPESLSPVHHVSKEAPPCIIFHGKADDTVPYATAELFASEMQEAGVICVLHGYDGEGHGFFNAGKKPAGGNEPALPQTLAQLDTFLVELGWLD